MPSFASEIKREICNVPIKAPCCSVAELAGVICYGAVEKNNILYVKTEASFVAKRVYQLVKECLDMKCTVIRTGNSRRIYRVEIATADEIAKVYEKTGVSGQNVAEEVLDKFCCKKAFFRGVFLATGSCNDPKKSYHLEFSISKERSVETIIKLFEEIDMKAGILLRRNSKVVYLKDSDNIADTVGYMGATNSMMEIQRVKIYKVFKNNITRTVNFESANISKAAVNAAHQREIIRKIMDNIGLDSLEKSLRELALLRLEHECSLKELGEMMSKPLSKSGVNHKFKKLAEIAQSIKD